MSRLHSLYRHSLSLLTDLYQLTMAYGYWHAGMAEREAAFNLFFRRHPFGGGYTIAAGLDTVIGYLDDFGFAEDELAYLAGLTGNDGKALFPGEFLDYLGKLKLTCDIDAVPEGETMFPHEPLLTVRGPLIQCQLLETALLNILNFQTLIATKSSRICHAAQGEPVLEFGLRRAQGIDGALAASRAAYVGGCAATSNVLAGKLYDIPVRGTHAHSWVMSFDTELEAFETYAQAMPNNCVFLVDTYDTLAGVRHAIEIGQRLTENGYQMGGIRLDSGDLAQLSIAARELLDEAGFHDASIVASNDLDEYAVQALKAMGAKISVWGIGTRLVTAHDQPALGGVYKLGAIQNAQGDWQYRVKLSEEAIKVSNPGWLQVRRFRKDGKFCGDMLYNRLAGEPDNTCAIVDLKHPDQSFEVGSATDSEDLLKPLMRQGKLLMDATDIEQARTYAQARLTDFDTTVFNLTEPMTYAIGLEAGLHQLKARLMQAANG